MVAELQGLSRTASLESKLAPAQHPAEKGQSVQLGTKGLATMPPGTAETNKYVHPQASHAKKKYDALCNVLIDTCPLRPGHR